MVFKIHKIKTVLKYLVESWSNSAFIKQQNPKTNRISAYLSLLYWFYFYGNDFNDYCTFRFWNKTNTERKSYISLRRNDILRFALSTPRVHKLFLDKGEFNHRFANYIKRKWMLTQEASNAEIHEFVTAYSTKSHASEGSGVIAKPLTDFGGHGILKFDSSSVFNNSLIEYLKEHNYILEECIVNNHNLKILAPGSLNTVRIVTLIDKDNKLHILAAVLRMGNGRAFTDNYHDGGMACAIDVETGKLKGNAFGMGCEEYVYHPYSQIKFDGYVIPKFNECLKIAVEISKVEPEARYVGWDFAITPSGIELLEGNIPPGEDITQIAAGRGLWYEIINLI